MAELDPVAGSEVLELREFDRQSAVPRMRMTFLARLHSNLTISPVPCSRQAGHRGRRLTSFRPCFKNWLDVRPSGGVVGATNRRAGRQLGRVDMGKRRGTWLVPGVLAIGLAVAGGTVAAGDAGAASSGSGGIGHADQHRRHLLEVGPAGRHLRGAVPGHDRLLQHHQRQGWRQRAQDRAHQQPGRRGVAQPVHPGRPHPHRPGPRLRRGRGVGLVHPGVLRVDQDPDLRLQRHRPTGRARPTCSPWAGPPRSTPPASRR